MSTPANNIVCLLTFCVTLFTYRTDVHFNSFHVYIKLTKYYLGSCKTCLLRHLALFCAIQLGFLYVVKITTGQILDYVCAE